MAHELNLFLTSPEVVFFFFLLEFVLDLPRSFFFFYFIYFFFFDKHIEAGCALLFSQVSGMNGEFEKTKTKKRNQREQRQLLQTSTLKAVVSSFGIHTLASNQTPHRTVSLSWRYSMLWRWVRGCSYTYWKILVFFLGVLLYDSFV